MVMIVIIQKPRHIAPRTTQQAAVAFTRLANAFRAGRLLNTRGGTALFIRPPQNGALPAGIGVFQFQVFASYKSA